MTHFTYLSGRPSADDEDLVQEAWCKALARTSERPNARTPAELIERYQHIAGLVTHIFRHERIKAYARVPHLPIEDDIPVTDDTPLDDAIASCTPQQMDAIRFYLSVIDQGRPLTTRERMKLSYLRKTTGLALVVPRHRKDAHD